MDSAPPRGLRPGSSPASLADEIFKKHCFAGAFFLNIAALVGPGGDSDDSIKHVSERGREECGRPLKAHDPKSEGSVAQWRAGTLCRAPPTTNLSQNGPFYDSKGTITVR